MEDFVHRTITESIELPGKQVPPVVCTVMRTRTSKGFASITLRIEGKEILKISNINYGDFYEVAVRDIAHLLLQIANNSCKLPEVP